MALCALCACMMHAGHVWVATVARLLQIEIQSALSRCQLTAKDRVKRAGCGICSYRSLGLTNLTRDGEEKMKKLNKARRDWLPWPFVRQDDGVSNPISPGICERSVRHQRNIASL